MVWQSFGLYRRNKFIRRGERNAVAFAMSVGAVARSHPEQQLHLQLPDGRLPPNIHDRIKGEMWRELTIEQSIAVMDAILFVLTVDIKGCEIALLLGGATYEATKSVAKVYRNRSSYADLPPLPENSHGKYVRRLRNLIGYTLGVSIKSPYPSELQKDPSVATLLSIAMRRVQFRVQSTSRALELTLVARRVSTLFDAATAEQNEYTSANEEFATVVRVLLGKYWKNAADTHRYIHAAFRYAATEVRVLAAQCTEAMHADPAARARTAPMQSKSPAEICAAPMQSKNPNETSADPGIFREKKRKSKHEVANGKSKLKQEVANEKSTLYSYFKAK